MVRVSKFYKEAKNGHYLRYLHEDTRTLYETFRRGVKESSKSFVYLLMSVLRPYNITGYVILQLDIFSKQKRMIACKTT